MSLSTHFAHVNKNTHTHTHIVSFDKTYVSSDRFCIFQKRRTCVYVCVRVLPYTSHLAYRYGVALVSRID